MNWKKKGIIFKANGQYDWMNSHTTPAAGIVLESSIRIFITTRSKIDSNGNYVSYTSFIDVDKKDPSKVLYTHDKSLIDLGGPGTFDEYGVVLAKPVLHDGKVYLYYMGWQRYSGETVPYQVLLGLAISEDNGLTFKKVSEGPVMSTDIHDHYTIGNISVIVEDGIWKMWYTNVTKWMFEGEKPTPSYNIKYAESKDGIHWEKSGIVCIEENELGGVATPSVLKLNNEYHMWFGYRPPFDKDGKVSGYDIGYATSRDGIHWLRDDYNSGIYKSESGWDSEMVCYPHVIELEDRIIMLYCGNGFGYSGFGYAELIN